MKQVLITIKADIDERILEEKQENGTYPKEQDALLDQIRKELILGHGITPFIWDYEIQEVKPC